MEPMWGGPPPHHMQHHVQPPSVGPPPSVITTPGAKLGQGPVPGNHIINFDSSIIRQLNLNKDVGFQLQIFNVLSLKYIIFVLI